MTFEQRMNEIKRIVKRDIVEPMCKDAVRVATWVLRKLIRVKG